MAVPKRKVFKKYKKFKLNVKSKNDFKSRKINSTYSNNLNKVIFF